MPLDRSGLLVPVDPAALGDWRTFVTRIRHADSEAAVRLSVTGDVLVLTASPLYPRGFGDDMPLVLGMRMLRLLDPAHDGLDVVVEARALLDRFARLDNEDSEGDSSRGVAVPPVEVTVPWAGVSPPRGPWEPVGTLSAGLLTRAAESGIVEVAEGAPSGSGAHAVDALRRRVWSRTAAQVAPAVAGTEPVEVSAGASFGAYVLGFLPGEQTSGVEGSRDPGRGALSREARGGDKRGSSEQVHVLRCGIWKRVSLPGGHILTR